MLGIVTGARSLCAAVFGTPRTSVRAQSAPMAMAIGGIMPEQSAASSLNTAEMRALNQSADVMETLHISPRM